MWSYEEMWHGDAIGRVLAAHGDDADIPRIAALRQGRPDPFADPAGRAMAARIDRSIDRSIDRLPGLADLAPRGGGRRSVRPGTRSGGTDRERSVIGPRRRRSRWGVR